MLGESGRHVALAADIWSLAPDSDVKKLELLAQFRMSGPALGVCRFRVSAKLSPSAEAVDEQGFGDIGRLPSLSEEDLQSLAPAVGVKAGHVLKCAKALVIFGPMCGRLTWRS